MPRPDHTKDIASVRRQAAKGGLRFEAYLPPDLAEWVISLVEQDVFHSPSEAVFVAMQSFRELDDYPNLKWELLNRAFKKASIQRRRAAVFLLRRSWHALGKRWNGHERNRPCGRHRSTGYYFLKTHRLDTSLSACQKTCDISGTAPHPLGNYRARAKII
jgi:hypothetical protein